LSLVALPLPSSLHYWLICFALLSQRKPRSFVSVYHFHLNSVAFSLRFLPRQQILKGGLPFGRTLSGRRFRCPDRRALSWSSKVFVLGRLTTQMALPWQSPVGVFPLVHCLGCASCFFCYFRHSCVGPRALLFVLLRPSPVPVLALGVGFGFLDSSSFPCSCCLFYLRGTHGRHMIDRRLRLMPPGCCFLLPTRFSYFLFFPVK